MKKTSPFLSIIMPNFNHSKYLNESIGAILNQPYKDFELIFIDDASTDNSLDIVKAYQKDFSNIKIYQNKQNLGVIQTINKGIAHSIGEYVSFCAADDIIFTDFFKMTIRCIKKNPSIAICSGKSCYFFDQDKIYVYRKSKYYRDVILVMPSQITKYLKTTDLKIETYVSVYKREVVLKKRGHIEDLKALADWYLNYQIAFDYDVAFIPETLGAVRIAKNSYAHQYMPYKSKRDKIFKALFNQISKEPQRFQRDFMKSGIIRDLGLRMTQYLIYRPKYWVYLFYTLKFVPKMIFQKLRKSIKNKFNVLKSFAPSNKIL